MSDGYSRAGFGRRFLAILIDWCLASLTSLLFIPTLTSELLPLVIRHLIFIFQVALLTALTGSSAGQKLFGLRVVSWPDQGYLKPLPAFLRTIMIALVIPAVVYDVEGRGLHDRLARSVVVRYSSGS